MSHVLILGANGQLARNTTHVFLRDTDANLTLYLRQALYDFVRAGTASGNYLA